MQDYLLRLSGRKLYTLYVAARRKRFDPESPEAVMRRLVETMAEEKSVVDTLPDLYRLARFSEDFEEFRERYAEVLERAAEAEAGRGP
mgnify:CR=1 FL=1|jgi:hypothetical protein